MKRLLPLLLLAATPIFGAEGAMTPDERTYLLDQLQTSKEGMLSAIKGLTPAQWTFKPAPAVWSVQECAEHLILAEDFIFGNAQQMLKTPAVPRPAASTGEVDRKLMAGVQDRTHKLSAPEPIVPSGKFATPEDAAKEFAARRDKTIAYVTSTDDPFRVHVAPGPAGPMDAYQFIILIAGHSARHTAQMREVESNPNYPKAP